MPLVEVYDSPAVENARALLNARIELARAALDRDDAAEFARNYEQAEDALMALGNALQEEHDKRRNGGT